MNEDDPFGIGDADRTVIKPVTPRPVAAQGAGMPETPVPGASGSHAAAPRWTGLRDALRASAGRRPAPQGPGVSVPRVGVNPVAAAAAPLLTLAARLRTASPSVPVEALREQVIEFLRDFEDRASNLGLSRDAVRAAHYALCATVDDIVLNTPWGNGSAWAAGTMTSRFHNEVTGGERFFELLDRLLRNPAPNREVLELMYLCLALGFEGRYRPMRRGPAELARLREQVHQAIAGLRGPPEPEISVSWRGVPAPFRTGRAGVPAWVAGALAAFLLLAVFMAFSYRLNVRSDGTLALMAALPPLSAPGIERDPPLPAALPAATVPAPPRPEALREQRLRRFLEAEIAEGLVDVLETPEGTTVRLRARGMFGSGSASLDPRYRPVLDRVGRALEDEPGQVRVIGYTDATPIRTVRFPSNWHLSKARAETVRDQLARILSDGGRLSAEGRGEMDPVASNGDPLGRELNRRTEIVLRAGPGPGPVAGRAP
ncbi:type VI secretion system protein TssL, long form [Arenibaculum pallidiluteum]|uniref:type VI secretion system protein TssL, long form n=1 Tax=Arenibaculum pallidiluteum TaxID=2812559 RepID=UPI001A975E98|nr:type VI secretion system protein TssL, long form [Arenibaculum pallidiluteum]